jgi:hypothetical protein
MRRRPRETPTVERSRSGWHCCVSGSDGVVACRSDSSWHRRVSKRGLASEPFHRQVIEPVPRHARDRGVPLPMRYLDVALCGAALRGLLSEGFSGVVARQGARPVGVMCGRTLDGVGFVPAHGIALDPGATEPSKVMVELFAGLAPVLVADGAVRVTVDHVDHEGLAIALCDHGFGREGVLAVRGTEPIDAEPAVEVRVGTAADLDSIAALSHIEFLYRSTSPMYALDQIRSLAGTRAVHESLLHDGAIHLLARGAERDVGLLTIEHTVPAPRLCATGSPYIGRDSDRSPRSCTRHSSGHVPVVTT